MSSPSDPLSPDAQWEMAFVYAFVSFFQGHADHGLHPFPDLQPEDLEHALTMQTSDLLDDLLGSFLSNVLNRKKPLDSKQYVKELSKLINSKTNEIGLDRNPFQHASSFGTLSASVKLRILRALVELQLQDSNAVRSVIDTAPKASPLLRAEPIGVDAERRTYWHFGDAAWLWREKISIRAKCQWETVCRDLQGLQQFADTLSQEKRTERDLYHQISEQIIPSVEDAQRRRERRERARERQVVAEQLITARRLRPRQSIRPARYTFDDDFETAAHSSEESDGFEDEEAETPEPKRIRMLPVRSSSRLNPERHSLSPSPSPSSENGHVAHMTNEVDPVIVD